MLMSVCMQLYVRARARARASCVVLRASCVVRRASCVVRHAPCVMCHGSCAHDSVSMPTRPHICACARTPRRTPRRGVGGKLRDMSEPCADLPEGARNFCSFDQSPLSTADLGTKIPHVRVFDSNVILI